MYIVYEPKGKAREYSPLALNIYNGCDHLCKYCYVKTAMNFNTILSKNDVTVRNNVLSQLEKDCKKGLRKQVLLSFTGDPYCSADVEYEMTRKVLKMLLEYNVPTAILTKGGKRCLRDIDIFKKFGGLIKVGATLTFDNPEHSLYYESGASLPADRIDTLKALKENGIRTWVSLEPVFSMEQTLNLIETTKDFVDEYKIGKLNHYKVRKEVDWVSFLIESVNICNKYNKEFYIKNDLYNCLNNAEKASLNIIPENRDMEYLTVKFNDTIFE